VALTDELVCEDVVQASLQRPMCSCFTCADHSRPRLNQPGQLPNIVEADVELLPDTVLLGLELATFRSTPIRPRS
jgi:hypothetical protein